MVFILWKYFFFFIIRLEFKHGGNFHKNILIYWKDGSIYTFCFSLALTVLISKRNIYVNTLHLVYFVIYYCWIGSFRLKALLSSIWFGEFTSGAVSPKSKVEMRNSFCVWQSGQFDLLKLRSGYQDPTVCGAVRAVPLDDGVNMLFWFIRLWAFAVNEQLPGRWSQL